MAPEKKIRPPATLNGASWGDSNAKKLMAQDLIDGFIPLEGPVNTEELFNRLYADHPFFDNFPFDKTRYDARLRTLRTQVVNFKKWADYDAKAILEDFKVYPPDRVNVRGELRFDGSEAQALLKADVANKLYETMKPKELWQSREEYHTKFSLKKFRKHLDQMKESEKRYVDNGKKYTKNVIGNKEFSRLSLGG